IPVFTMFMNHRDHRKIMVVDGKIGFMGGVNLADEYINHIDRFGHWKDTAVRLEGDAVYSLTAMFASMWNAISPERCDTKLFAPIPAESGNGIIQPYSDTPLDREQVGETVYLNMINRAEKYIYICTPYLITDNETITALINAAKSGIDVRIITPHHGDKWYVHAITRFGYEQLIKGGVKIYEYSPGFIHAKLFVADDNVATVGTVNLDFRSLYLHFECGVWFGGGTTPISIREDFTKTLEKCIEITEDSPIVRKKGLKKLICSVLKLFAPLM
ncbi:MAG: cardiolipin synthase, partial [Oscillospiraceae bacterium]|nr:cardiolipin synthase [Oscillospiraceae bacterium]